MSQEDEPQKYCSIMWVNKRGKFVESDIPLETTQEISDQTRENAQNGIASELKVTQPDGSVFYADDAWVSQVYDPNSGWISNN